eukprot:716720-Pyramimonas_sp.AAC.1
MDNVGSVGGPAQPPLPVLEDEDLTVPVRGPRPLVGQAALVRTLRDWELKVEGQAAPLWKEAFHEGAPDL